MTQNLKQILVQGVVARIPEVSEIYHNSPKEKRDLIARNIELDYEDECGCRSELMTIEEYCEDKDNSIGWSWIEDPIIE